MFYGRHAGPNPTNEAPAPQPSAQQPAQQRPRLVEARRPPGRPGAPGAAPPPPPRRSVSPRAGRRGPPHEVQDPAVAVVLPLVGRCRCAPRLELDARRRRRHGREAPSSSGSRSNVSSPVSPSDSTDSPSGNCSGSTPIPPGWSGGCARSSRRSRSARRAAAGPWPPSRARSRSRTPCPPGPRTAARPRRRSHRGVVDRLLLAVAQVVKPPSVPGASRLRRRMLANVPRIITSWLPRRDP